MAEQGADGVVGATEVVAPGVGGAGEPEDPLIGQLIDGRYRVERKLGEGGMGLVYRAVHQGLDRAFAIKVMRAEVSKNAEIVARFEQEARSASAIGNRHIIDIIDFGVLPGGATYFVMEFLSGTSLTAALEVGRFTPARTVHVAKQLCKALGAAHAIGVVHRDLKPDNVQLVDPGDRDFVKVLDFGIAKVSGSASKLTQVGQVFGTPHYMSPEQCEGNDVDHRTDIYAVGVMLYEMATGRVPFDADNLMAVLSMHLHKTPTPPSEVSSPVDVSAGLEEIILRCLSKHPDDRYASTAELLAALEAVDLGRRSSAVVGAAPHATRRTPQRTSDFPPVQSSATRPSASTYPWLRRSSRRWLAIAALGALGAATLAAAALWPEETAPVSGAREAAPVVAAPRPAPRADPARLPAVVSAEARATIAVAADNAVVAAPADSDAHPEPAKVAAPAPAPEMPAKVADAPPFGESPVAEAPVAEAPVAEARPAPESAEPVESKVQRAPPAPARVPKRTLRRRAPEPSPEPKSDPLDAILEQNTRRVDTILDM